MVIALKDQVIHLHVRLGHTIIILVLSHLKIVNHVILDIIVQVSSSIINLVIVDIYIIYNRFK